MTLGVVPTLTSPCSYGTFETTTSAPLLPVSVGAELQEQGTGAPAVLPATAATTVEGSSGVSKQPLQPHGLSAQLLFGIQQSSLLATQAVPSSGRRCFT